MRTPNPMILRHKAHINIAALALVALGFMAVFDSRYQVAGAVTMLLTFLVWARLQNSIRPIVADYLAYLKMAAEKDMDMNVDDWLASVDAEFLQIWGIKSLEELTHE